MSLALACHAAAAEWRPIRWHDEAAHELATTEWRAVVSVERGRLVHFGPSGSDSNLLVAAASKATPAGWGGHRVWLGPQNTWTPFWPPPAAWERSAAASVQVEKHRLTLAMPDAGDGWPRLTRVYELVDGQLACRVITAAGGTRSFQIMHILQTQPADDLTVPVVPTDEAPLGCMLLPPFRGRRAMEPLLEPLDYMTRVANGLRIHHPAPLDKIAFAPQTLVARYDAGVLEVARGTLRGAEVGAPDQGYDTQICPGQESTPAVELEQMSPLFPAGEPAEFTVLLNLRKRP